MALPVSSPTMPQSIADRYFVDPGDSDPLGAYQALLDLADRFGWDTDPDTAPGVPGTVPVAVVDMGLDGPQLPAPPAPPTPPAPTTAVSPVVIASVVMAGGGVVLTGLALVIWLAARKR